MSVCGHYETEYNALWPWRQWMTIGIGALCSERKEGQDHIVLCCDSLGSLGDSSSNPSLHKLFAEAESNLYAVASGDILGARQLMGKIRTTVKGRGSIYGKIHDAICVATQAHKNAKFMHEVLPKYAIPPSPEWKEEAIKVGLLDKILAEWEKYPLGCQLIVGTFAEEGTAHLFHVKADGSVEAVNFVTAVGSGAYNAMFWLSYREQNLGMGLRRSAYHVYEAKLMAEKSPHVGKDDIEMLIASSQQGPFILTRDTPELPNCPVSLTEIMKMWEKYGVKSTEEIDSRGPLRAPNRR